LTVALERGCRGGDAIAAPAEPFSDSGPSGAAESADELMSKPITLSRHVAADRCSFGAKSPRSAHEICKRHVLRLSRDAPPAREPAAHGAARETSSTFHSWPALPRFC
jgi:hypothetical protein